MDQGLRSIKTLTAAQIAKKHKLPLHVILRQIAKGMKVEKEHTKDRKEAIQIARDHIAERPDYYEKLDKMEKSKVSKKLKEETFTTGIGGLGFKTGTPAVDEDNGYVSTNSLAYDPFNGAKLEFMRNIHNKLHKSLGFNEYNPTSKKHTNKDLAESKHPLQVNFDKYKKGKLDELGGDYDRTSQGVEVIGDLTGTAKKVMKVDEGALKDKAKKIAVAGMTAANMYTLADVAGRATEGGHGSPKGDIVRAATATPGAFGWGATALHYGNKGYKLARQALNPKKDKMKNEEQIKEDLRKWFREKWVRYDTKGNIKGPCARDEGEGKPKCRPLASARSMSKAERAKSARRKRREDPVADRPGKGGKPIMVRTNEETLLEKNVPTNPELWARAKAQAKAKFDVYPSAYANGWASKWYKSKGGGWKTAANESINEACWDTHKQEGMKKKGGKMVPNCVPKEETSVVPARSVERGIYEGDDREVVYTHKKGPLYGTVTQHADGTIETRRKVGMFWRGRTHSSKEAAIAHLENDGKKKKLREETDASDETNMAKSQLKAIGAKSKNLVSNLKGSKNLPAWVQSKIAVAKDGITAVDDYMTHSDRKLDEKWSKKYKDSIDCSNPKGFSQKAHCDGKKKQVKEYIEPYFITAHKEGEDSIRKKLGGRMSQALRANKPDAGLHPGAKGMLDKTIYETKETKMDTKEHINEALDNILDENLSEMKENFMQALQEKAMEKLEERKKIIAANYFAQ